MNLHVVRNNETDFQNTLLKTPMTCQQWFWQHSNCRRCLGPVCLGDKGLLTAAINLHIWCFIIMPFGEETVKWQALILWTQADGLWAIIGAKLPSWPHNKHAPCEMPKQTRNSGKGDNFCSTLNDDVQHIVHIHTYTLKTKGQTFLHLGNISGPLKIKLLELSTCKTWWEQFEVYSPRRRFTHIGELASAKFAHCNSSDVRVDPCLHITVLAVWEWILVIGQQYLLWWSQSNTELV